ncbi:hypothetical protein ACFWV1_26300 [Streptomyces sp. NPDC058700]|uniref:hypothetical protein n=1 Tax=Streptomyces sp. NPDC058700 TaxID=3346607 RepID=UPI00364EEA58
MNTTAAATEARVTVATIRTWCRIGAVAATKTAGRWIIDTASLARRLAIGAMKRPARKPAPLTAEAVIALGGRRWQKNGMDRVYLNDWLQYTGIEVSHYNTGNISGASIDGRGVANGRIGRIIATVSKVYFDTADGQLHVQHYGADSIEVRYLDGERNYLNLVNRIFTGIKTAAAH